VLNGEARDVAAKDMAALLEECGFSGRVATSLNEAFVPAGLRAVQTLADGDRVEVVAPMQGG
jgi:sulfur carrier protein